MTQLPSSPPSSDPSEESLKAAGAPKMDAAFNGSYYTPAIRLLAIFSAGCELERECQSLRAQAAMAGELFDHLEQLWDHCIDLGENEDSEAGVAITALLARFSATKSTKEAT